MACKGWPRNWCQFRGSQPDQKFRVVLQQEGPPERETNCLHRAACRCLFWTSFEQLLTPKDSQWKPMPATIKSEQDDKNLINHCFWCFLWIFLGFWWCLGLLCDFAKRACKNEPPEKHHLQVTWMCQSASGYLLALWKVLRPDNNQKGHKKRQGGACVKFHRGASVEFCKSRITTLKWHEKHNSWGECSGMQIINGLLLQFDRWLRQLFRSTAFFFFFFSPSAMTKSLRKATLSFFTLPNWLQIATTKRILRRQLHMYTYCILYKIETSGSLIGSLESKEPNDSWLILRLLLAKLEIWPPLFVLAPLALRDVMDRLLVSGQSSQPYIQP